MTANHTVQACILMGPNGLIQYYYIYVSNSTMLFLLICASLGPLLALSSPIGYASSDILPLLPAFDVSFWYLSYPISEVADLALHFLFHLKRFRNIQPFLDRWSRIDAIQPSFEIFEDLYVNTCPFSPIDPCEGGKICNGHLITDNPWPI